MAPFLGQYLIQGPQRKISFHICIFRNFIDQFIIFVQQGDWQLAAALYVVGAIGFSSGNVFYDSLLPAVAKKPKYDFVSSLGYSMGYLGGGVLFIINI